MFRNFACNDGKKLVTIAWKTVDSPISNSGMG